MQVEPAGRLGSSECYKGLRGGPALSLEVPSITRGAEGQKGYREHSWWCSTTSRFLGREGDPAKGRMPADGGKRCSYSGCESPDKSNHFFEIEEGRKSGGQDWSSLVGSVLCQACYGQFCRKGSLERTQNKPLSASERRCTYEHCDDPAKGTTFLQIGKGRTSGGKDWSPVAGMVLCKACYLRFERKGKLERTVNKPLAKTSRHCTYEHCDRPGQSNNFYQIQKGRTSGGKDWSPIVGMVLCEACYCRFKDRGTLIRCESRPLRPAHPSKKQKTASADGPGQKEPAFEKEQQAQEEGKAAREGHGDEKAREELEGGQGSKQQEQEHQQLEEQQQERGEEKVKGGVKQGPTQKQSQGEERPRRGEQQWSKQQPQRTQTQQSYGENTGKGETQHEGVKQHQSQGK